MTPRVKKKDRLNISDSSSELDDVENNEGKSAFDKQLYDTAPVINNIENTKKVDAKLQKSSSQLNKYRSNTPNKQNKNTDSNFDRTLFFISII